MRGILTATSRPMKTNLLMLTVRGFIVDVQESGCAQRLRRRRGCDAIERQCKRRILIRRECRDGTVGCAKEEVCVWSRLESHEQKSCREGDLALIESMPPCCGDDAVSCSASPRRGQRIAPLANTRKSKL